MNIRETFLKLTEWTIPFGYESELEPLLPKGWVKDNIGNYFYEIGNSETLFTSHLDVACESREKVNHVIEGNIIKTDGTTILGGDNKAGCVILFNLIENNIPGTYYFFIGEEASVDGDYPYGSILALEEKRDFFKKFKRVISFDRKEKDQLITRQLGRKMCSDDFAKSLIDDFKKSGINYKVDKTGYYTDSAFFSDDIGEIVNLSCGVWNEHTKSEYVDISYIEKVAKASVKVDWEKLPSVRKPDNIYEIDTRKNVDSFTISGDAELFSIVFNILDELYFVCHEFRSYKNFTYLFKSGRIYHFTKWHDDLDLSISIKSGIITCNEKDYNLDEFKKFLGIEKMDINEFRSLLLGEFSNNDNRLTDAEFNYLLYQKGNKIEDLKKSFRDIGWNLNKIGKGYEIIKESRIIKKYFLFLESIK